METWPLLLTNDRPKEPPLLSNPAGEREQKEMDFQIAAAKQINSATGATVAKRNRSCSQQLLI